MVPEHISGQVEMKTDATSHFKTSKAMMVDVGEVSVR